MKFKNRIEALEDTVNYLNGTVKDLEMLIKDGLDTIRFQMFIEHFRPETIKSEKLRNEMLEHRVQNGYTFEYYHVGSTLMRKEVSTSIKIADVLKDAFNQKGLTIRETRNYILDIVQKDKLISTYEDVTDRTND